MGRRTCYNLAATGGSIIVAGVENLKKMSKRRFGFEGFGISKKTNFEFEAQPAKPRLYLPSPSRNRRSDNVEDHDLDNIGYEDDERDSENFMDRALPNASRSSQCASGSLGKPLKGKQDEPWFGSDDDDNDNHAGGGAVPDDDEVDPLDAFMEGIREEVKKAPVKPRAIVEELEDDEDDPMESFLKARRDAGLSLAAEALHAGYDSDEEVYAAAKAVDNGQIEYDFDDNAIVTLDKKKIESLAPLDHSDLDYDRFSKDFYEESASISSMTEEEVAVYRKSLAIRVSGFDVSRPVKTFEDLSFDPPLMNAMAKQGYEKPTAIQCQACPIVLSGRDLIGIAKTGSGKTAAFVLPMMVHIMDQPDLSKGEGPIGVICAPTRELAQQIYSEAKKFAKVYGIRVSGVYGGMSKFEQFKELKAGCEVVVATPGRLIDMIKMKALTMRQATYVVLDEADRMFDLGFEPQIRSIVGQIRPDRQTLLFSATMPKRVERLAREILTDPIRVTVGEVGSANEDITQVVTVLPSDAEKTPWLIDRLQNFVDDGDVLVFASTKLRVEELEGKITEKGFKVAALHGDKSQATRMEVLQNFKNGIYHILVATDVAARGKEARFAGELVTSLIAAGQNVPTELKDLAMKDGRYRAQREGQRKGGGGGGGGGGGRGKGRGRGGGQGKDGRGGGGGRNVRGVDFGLGIGYSADAASTAPSAPLEKTPKVQYKREEVPTRGTAVDSLKLGMMARFKSSFVAANTANSVSYTPSQANTPQGLVYGAKPTVNGKGRGNFVSAGIGFGSQSGSGFTSAGSSAHTLGDFQGGNAVGRQVPSSTGSTGGIPPSLNASYSREVLNAGCVPPAATAVGVERAVDRDGGRERERSRWDRDQDQITNSKQDPREASSLEDGKPDHQSDRERPRQRRRPSGWDR
ncbi:DEAD-box ATP-dependent RNA helicase 24 isoform X3 [Physcomitrium patens]|uniref:DEAD-box ATP-dependent RNA helicase 24 isoform X3 n=1 Tax=Physcomitrium patens TaxID=3218 RepID=UPI003CCE46A9